MSGNSDVFHNQETRPSQVVTPNQVASTQNNDTGQNISTEKLDMDANNSITRCVDTDNQINLNCEKANSEDEFHSADEGGDTDSDEDVIPQNENLDNAVNDDSIVTDFNHSGKDIEGECDDGKNCDSASFNSESDTEEKEANELEARKRLEESLTAEELEDRKFKGQQLKDEGNIKFRSGALDEASNLYTEALKTCPLNCQKERSIMFSNRAACYMKQEVYDTAIKDSCSALDLNPTYMKALLRRAELYEKTEKLDEALKDYQQIIQLDPAQHMARAKCLKLTEQINDRNEKMKEEMMGKLKDLGNMVLRPFGLSTNNFKMQQDPSTGGYSMQFVNNPGNGS